MVPPRPALAPVTTSVPWVPPLRGVTIPDVGVRVVAPDGRVLEERRGSLLFAHFGLTGPAALDVSRAVRCRAAGKKQVAGLLDPWLPRRLAETLFRLAGTPPDRRAAEFGKRERSRLVEAVTALAIPVTGTLGFEKAEVTAGGVALDEIDSRSMASRRVPGLFLAGELLDLDGWIGGYNFQSAFSTGWLAGESV